MIIVLSLATIFHLLVISGIIPFEIVWGGRLNDQSQMLIFETVSIAINLIMSSVIGIEGGFLKWNVNKKIIQIALWVMFGIFFVNTIGNCFSNNEFEKLVFTPLTMISAIFCLRLAITKDK